MTDESGERFVEFEEFLGEILLRTTQKERFASCLSHSYEVVGSVVERLADGVGIFKSNAVECGVVDLTVVKLSEKLFVKTVGHELIDHSRVKATVEMVAHDGEHYFDILESGIVGINRFEIERD